jgi:hypothetical protein
MAQAQEQEGGIVTIMAITITGIMESMGKLQIALCQYTVAIVVLVGMVFTRVRLRRILHHSCSSFVFIILLYKYNQIENMFLYYSLPSSSLPSSQFLDKAIYLNNGTENGEEKIKQKGEEKPTDSHRSRRHHRKVRWVHNEKQFTVPV